MPQVKWPGVPPKEAIDYFKKKKLKPAFDYRDVWQAEHATAFTVAKALQVDVLADIQTALQKSLEEGKTFKQFQKELMPELQKKGWWGVRDMIDPETGDMKTVQLGSPRRLKTIYDANMRSARAAGQWDRAQRTKKTLPYFLYELGPSVEHREDHEAWAGTILPVDHPFWRTHFAPNGYGCKCRIRQITEREAQRLLAKSGYTSKAPKIEMVEWENKRTGEVEQKPKGIDPGWDTNPGYLRSQPAERSLVKKANVLDRINADDLLIDPVHINEYQDWVSETAKAPLVSGEQAFRTVAVMKAAEIDYLDDTHKSPADVLVLLPSVIIPRKSSNDSNKLGVDEFADLPVMMKQTKPAIFVSAREPKEMIYLYPRQDDSLPDEYLKVTVQVDMEIQGQTINRVSDVRYESVAYRERLENNADYDKVP